MALVGPSGAGKSTLVNLLPRFIEPSGGRITLDGVALPDWDLMALRQQFALVSQDVVLFNDTVAANVALGADMPRETIRDALRAALADGTLDALVSDHNPVAEDMKVLPFAEAEPGATGLELLLSLCLRWGEASGVPLAQALTRVTSAPAQVLGSALGHLSASAGRIVEGLNAAAAGLDVEIQFSRTESSKFPNRGASGPCGPA